MIRCTVAHKAGGAELRSAISAGASSRCDSCGAQRGAPVLLEAVRLQVGLPWERATLAAAGSTRSSTTLSTRASRAGQGLGILISVARTSAAEQSDPRVLEGFATGPARC